ncbi:MAG: LysM peptidoglycan-binding domain-containing protein [Hyphomicrobiaceae bacterium]
MRSQILVPAKDRPLLWAMLVATVTATLSGCAAPSLTNKSFPALSWGDDRNRLATGSIERQNLSSQPSAQNRPSLVRAPKVVATRPAETVAKAEATAPPPPAPPVIPYDELATYDPLPMYAGPDRKRNSYRWNGSHNRIAIDNRTRQAKLAGKSKVFVDANGRRTVRVAPGDTLFGIAHRNGISTNNLMGLNNMKRSELRAGQILVLPPNAH